MNESGIKVVGMHFIVGRTRKKSTARDFNVGVCLFTPGNRWTANTLLSLMISAWKKKVIIIQQNKSYPMSPRRMTLSRMGSNVESIGSENTKKKTSFCECTWLCDQLSIIIYHFIHPDILAMIRFFFSFFTTTMGMEFAWFTDPTTPFHPCAFFFLVSSLSLLFLDLLKRDEWIFFFLPDMVVKGIVLLIYNLLEISDVLLHENTLGTTYDFIY